MAKHFSLSFITDEQEANLRKLAAYLFTLPDDYPDFEMSSFTNDGRGYASDIAHVACGTAACAVGHGPSCGIKPRLGENWATYSHRVFIPDDGPVALTYNCWEWCFGACWSTSDNTCHGAAKRILFLLEHGLPENHIDICLGVGKLIYNNITI